MNTVEFIQKSEANLVIRFGERDLTGYSLKLIAKKLNDISSNNLKAVLNIDYILDADNFIDGVAYLKIPATSDIPAQSTDIEAGQYNFQIEISTRDFREAFKIVKLQVYSNINKE